MSPRYKLSNQTLCPNDFNYWMELGVFTMRINSFAAGVASLGHLTPGPLADERSLNLTFISYHFDFQTHRTLCCEFSLVCTIIGSLSALRGQPKWPQGSPYVYHIGAQYIPMTNVAQRIAMEYPSQVL